MLSGYSLDVVAYMHPAVWNGEVFCPNCWRTPGDTERDENIEREAAIIRYCAEEWANGMGLYCFACDKEIVEPDVDEISDDDYEEPSEEIFEDRPGAFEAESNQEYLNYPLPPESEQ